MLNMYLPKLSYLCLDSGTVVLQGQAEPLLISSSPTVTDIVNGRVFLVFPRKVVSPVSNHSGAQLKTLHTGLKKEW